MSGSRSDLVGLKQDIPDLLLFEKPVALKELVTMGNNR